MRESSNQAGHAYTRIRDAVLGGVFPVGSVLTENQLAEYVGTSRTPVREAIHRLELEQIVMRDDRGIAVPDPGPDEIYEIYEVRGLLSAANARLADRTSSSRCGRPPTASSHARAGARATTASCSSSSSGWAPRTRTSGARRH